MTRQQAIDYLYTESMGHIALTAISEDEYEAGKDDMYRAFAALGVDRKEVDGE